MRCICVAKPSTYSDLLFQILNFFFKSLQYFAKLDYWLCPCLSHEFLSLGQTGLCIEPSLNHCVIKDVALVQLEGSSTSQWAEHWFHWRTSSSPWGESWAGVLSHPSSLDLHPLLFVVVRDIRLGSISMGDESESVCYIGPESYPCPFKSFPLNRANFCCMAFFGAWVLLNTGKNSLGSLRLCNKSDGLVLRRKHFKSVLSSSARTYVPCRLYFGEGPRQIAWAICCTLSVLLCSLVCLATSTGNNVDTSFLPPQGEAQVWGVQAYSKEYAQTPDISDQFNLSKKSDLAGLLAV